MTIALMPLTSHQWCSDGGGSKQCGEREKATNLNTFSLNALKGVLKNYQRGSSFSQTDHLLHILSPHQQIQHHHCLHRHHPLWWYIVYTGVLATLVGGTHCEWLQPTQASTVTPSQPRWTLNTAVLHTTQFTRNTTFYILHFTPHMTPCALHTACSEFKNTASDKSVLFLLGGAKF